MNKHMELTDIESDLMSFFWAQQTPVTFAQILSFCNDEMQWNWAKTTAHTYVTRLMQKGLLDMHDVRGVRRTYFAKISQAEYARRSAQRLLDTSFAGSVKKLFLSLVPNNRLTQSDVEELQQILDHMSGTEDSSDHR